MSAARSPASLLLALFGALPTARAAAQAVALAPARRASRDVETTVTQVAADGVYLGVGGDAGVVAGTRGTLERDGRVLAELEVRHVAAGSCFAAYVTIEPDAAVRAGDRVVLRGLAEPKPPTPRAPATGGGAAGSGAAPAAGSGSAPFQPLLAPPVAAGTESRGNFFHGSAGLGTSWLHDAENGRDYTNLRLFASGDVERIGGEPWSLQFRFDLNRRGGDGYDGDPKQDEWRLRADTLVARRHFEDGSVIGLGRFLPHALPGVGRIDGAYAEKVVGDGARIGSALGFRPDRDDLGVRRDELVLAGWGALEQRSTGGTRFGAALGGMASWYEGSADQHALLADLSAHFAGGHWLRTSAQLDLYGGDEARRSGAGLTRLHASGFWRASEGFGLRGSWSHYENPDTDSLRRIVPSDASYGRGRSRAAVAALESWKSGLALEQELAVLMGDGTPAELQGTLRARDATLFGAETFGGDLAVFNLVGLDQEGFGGGAGLTWTPSGDLSLRLGWDATTLEIDGGDAYFSQTASLFASQQLGRAASLWLRLAKSLGDDLDTLSADLGITWRF
ncbi:MAG: hypothetical protein JNL90_00285 [Planctomycetes bacterium]|nr:hypothetical protein [Planctomycetota bacterium]